MSECYLNKKAKRSRAMGEFGRVVSVTRSWRDDIKKAEALYVENPAEVDGFLKKMSIKELLTHEKRVRVSHLASRLIRDEITAIPPLVWQRSSAENADEEDIEPLEDQLIMNRFGFLFMACKIFTRVVAHYVCTSKICM